jgi:hypothetical protein
MYTGLTAATLMVVVVVMLTVLHNNIHVRIAM